MYSLDELIQPVTAKEIRQSLLDTLAIMGVPTTTWFVGSVIRAVVAAVSIVLAGLSALMVAAIRGGFLTTAEGPWKRLRAQDTYGVEPIEATFATGSVTVNNTGGGVYNEAAEAIVFVNTASNKTYRNTGAVTIPSLTNGIVIPVRAVEQGTDSNALAGQVDLQTDLLGVVVASSTAIVGQDIEEDAALDQRCLESLGAVSPNGPTDAYAYVAKSAVRADGSAIGVNRVRVIGSALNGTVQVYVAQPDGALDPGDVAVVNDEIQRKAVPIPITATVESATELSVPVTYEIWLPDSSGLTSEQINAAIQQAIVVYFATFPIGGFVVGVSPGKLFKEKLEAIIAQATAPSGASLGIFDVEVTVPAGDVSLTPGQVPVIGTVAPVALGIHQVAVH